MNVESLGKALKAAAEAAKGTDGAGVAVGVVLGAVATVVGMKTAQQDPDRQNDKRKKSDR